MTDNFNRYKIVREITLYQIMSDGLVEKNVSGKLLMIGMEMRRLG